MGIPRMGEGQVVYAGRLCGRAAQLSRLLCVRRARDVPIRMLHGCVLRRGGSTGCRSQSTKIEKRKGYTHHNLPDIIRQAVLGSDSTEEVIPSIRNSRGIEEHAIERCQSPRWASAFADCVGDGVCAGGWVAVWDARHGCVQYELLQRSRLRLVQACRPSC